MKSFNAFLRMVALAVITGVTGCGTSTGPANLTAEEKERQIQGTQRAERQGVGRHRKKEKVTLLLGICISGIGGPQTQCEQAA